MGRTAEDASCRLGNRERGLGRMKVLLIKPMEHPQVVDIENSLKEFYRILDCDCITATYPWEERAALVTDDNGLFTEKPIHSGAGAAHQGKLLHLWPGRGRFRRAAPGPDSEIQGTVLGAGGIRQHVRTDGGHPDG